MPDLIERVETALYNAPPWWIAAVFLLVLFAAAEAGQELPVKDAAALAARLFRPLRQRTTDYGEPDPDRLVGLR